MKPAFRAIRRHTVALFVPCALVASTPGLARAQNVINSQADRGLSAAPAPTGFGVAAVNTNSPSSTCRAQFLAARAKGDESFGCKWGRLRLGNSDEADRYFGGLEVGNSISLRVGQEETSLYTELVSDNLYVSSKLGFARLGFATLIAAAQDSTSDEAQSTADQFFQGGGNAVLYAALPMYVWINYAVDTAKGPLRQLNSFMTLAIAGDVPKLGTAVTESAGSLRAGVQADFTWRTHNERIGMFFNLRGNYVRGLSDAFYRNLLMADEDIPGWGLVAGDYSVGIDLSKLIRLGVSGGVSTHDAVSSKARLSLQLLPQK